MLANWAVANLLSDNPQATAPFSDGIRRYPHSNAYTALGRMTGTVRLQVNADAGMRITVVMKE